MKPLADAGRCPDCGTGLVAEPGIGGLCPQCLLSLALRESPQDDPHHGSAAPGEALTLDRPGPGRILGERYQIRELLGRGGMGEVFRAFDLKLRVDVALKAVRAEKVGSSRADELLRQEVRSAREVVSPNVCRIFDLVAEDGQELVSMEFIDGHTLGEVLKQRGPLPLHETREIASQFLSGLEAIHQAGLVHRDFKPENVMLTRAGRVVVMDFGLAKAHNDAGTGTIAGTPAYMPPEQARGGSVDARADVFAAGVVLAEMLSVGGLGSHDARQELWRAVRETPPRVPDGPWAPVLRQALSPDLQERHASARELARALEDVTQRLPGFATKRPYPGLSSFTEEDAEYFFGREVEVEAVWKKLKRPRMLALVAPSGAGKSSFLRAGLLPALPRGWKALVATPGNRPFQALAHALVPVFAGDTDAMAALLRFEEPETAVSLLQRFRRRHEHALLIVDQFEELFTLNPPEVQEAFARLLGRLVLDGDLHVILSLRDDFLYRCQAFEALAPATTDVTLLGTLGQASLRRALVQPALACGYRFEDEALVDEMVAEVRRERGALPLLAFAASRLWEKRDRERGLLTREAYREIGGVAGALAQHAEATLERIGTQRLPLVREIFRNLVTAQDTRAVREREELLSVFGAEGRSEAEGVLRALVDARLLTVYDRSDERGESHPQVEIIHESLLAAWPRLVRWQTQDADGAQLRDQLRQAAQAWHDRGRPEDLLWTGSAWRDLALWRERYGGGLSATEQAFADAAAQVDGRRRRRRRFAAASLVGMAAAVAIVTSVLWQRADAARRSAEAAQLLAVGRLRLDRNPAAALAFAIASLERADNQPARRFALEALWKAPMGYLLADSGPIGAPGFNADGRWLVASTARGTSIYDSSGALRLRAPETVVGATDDGAHLLTISTKREIHVRSLPGGEILSTWALREGEAFLGHSWRIGRPDRLLTMASEADATPETPSWLLRVRAFDDGAERVLGVWRPRDLQDFATDRSGKWLLSVESHQVLLRRLDDLGAPPRRLGRHEGRVSVQGERWTPDGYFVTSDNQGGIRIWDAGQARLERELRSPESAALTSLDPSRRYLYTAPVGGLPTGALRLFDLHAPRETEPQPLLDSDLMGTSYMRFHPNGEWLATGHDGVMRFWNLAGKRSLVLRGQKPPFIALAFTPEGRLVSASDEGVVRLWPLFTDPTARSRELWRSTAGTDDGAVGLHVDVDRAGRRAVVARRDDGTLIVLPLDGGPTQLRTMKNAFVRDASFDPSGERTAFFYDQSERFEAASIRVLDLASGDERELRPPQDGAACRATPGTRPKGDTPFWLPDGRLGSEGETGLRLWDLATGSSRLLRPCNEAALGAEGDLADYRATPDSRLLFGFQSRDPRAGRPSALWAFDLATGTERSITSHGSRVSALALDPTGTTLVTGDMDGVVRAGPASGGEPHLLYGHSRLVTSVAVSPDGKWIASGSEDGSIRLWPMPVGQPLHTLPLDELLTKLRALINLRVVPDPGSATGYKVEPGPFPGWAKVPEW